MFARRPVASIATTAALVLGLSMPAIAAAKTPVVIVPASVIANPAAKLCMPRSTSPIVAKDKSLPATLCQTVEAWAAHGVTVKAK
ncbi:hypothetical protein [Sphingomonas sp. Leaf343]|uniref:hypothetical protein n=1 Tax=Sphingomonas sp. Leaf343 TaxID=1736345 RepID=UPI0006FDAF86|nr:hypothetical protein [Sphingomonas sp. Leaf343]KQR80817.1 hypothetical protein ASG07_13565 [Sphingomonas sp. Leaf343]